MIAIGAMLGFLGGSVRAIIGLVKNAQKNKTITIEKLMITLIGAGIIGVFAIIFIPNDPKFCLLAGYGGTDFLENLWKLKLKELKK